MDTHEEFLEARDRVTQAQESVLKAEAPVIVELLIQGFSAFSWENIESAALNTEVVSSVAQSVVYDLLHHHEFHGLSDGYDPVRLASLVGKWLLKFRPISYPATNEAPSEKRLWINEAFALEMIMAIAGITSDSMDKQLFEQTIYTFRFRNYSEDHMALLVRSLRNSENRA